MGKIKLLPAAVFGLFFADVANAALVINVGSYTLLPNTPNQTVKIFVTGGDAVQGLNFYAQVADGGPAAGGTVTGPAITGVDILAGTIFAANNNGADNPGSVPQLAARTTTTLAGSVPGNGLLATLTFDTTGFTTQRTWSLNLKNTLNGPTDFAGTPATIADGSIIVNVPEPACILLLFVGLMLRLRRTRMA